MKIVVAQFFTNKISYGKYTKDINQKYCAVNDYIYHCEEDTAKIESFVPDRLTKWYKIKLIQDVIALHNPDYVLYLDADAMICDKDSKIENFIDSAYDLIFAKNYTKDFNFNTSVFLIKNNDTSNKLLDSWWRMSEVEGGKYKKDANGDKHCANKLYGNLTSLQLKIKIISNRSFNWHTFNDHSFIFHACGYEYLKNRKLDEMYLLLSPEQERILPIDSLELLGVTYLGENNPEVMHLKTAYADVLEKYKMSANNIALINIDVASLYIWRSYFQNANLIVIGDKLIVSKTVSKVQYIPVDVSKEQDTFALAAAINNVDVIIDCSSRGIIEQQVIFSILFEKLNPGGVYLIEGLETSIKPLSPSISPLTWSANSLNLKPVIYYSTLEMLKSISKGEVKSEFITAQQKQYIIDNVEAFNLNQANPSNLVGIIVKKINL